MAYHTYGIPLRLVQQTSHHWKTHTTESQLWKRILQTGKIKFVKSDSCFDTDLSKIADSLGFLARATSFPGVCLIKCDHLVVQLWPAYLSVHYIPVSAPKGRGEPRGKQTGSAFSLVHYLPELVRYPQRPECVARAAGTLVVGVGQKWGKSAFHYKQGNAKNRESGGGQRWALPPSALLGWVTRPSAPAGVCLL